MKPTRISRRTEGGDSYSSDESGQPEIYVRPFPNVDGGKRPISPDGGFAVRWGPDSRELFLQTSEGPGSPVTMMLAVNVTEPTFTPGIPGAFFDGPNRMGVVPRYWPFDVSPDGQRLVMIKEAPDSDAPSDQAQFTVVFNWFEELTRLVPTDP